jgi:tellurite resistance protein TehA-like permease
MLQSIGLVIRRLLPGYFAIVMATGIISIACWMLEMRFIAWSLFAINLVVYVILGLLTLARLIRYPGRILRDLRSYNRGPGFLTTVAATCILGSQVFLLANIDAAALVFWICGFVLWFVIMYSLYTITTIKRNKPGSRIVLHGSWFIPVVATQSVAVLGALLAPAFPGWTTVMLFLALCLFLLGGMLYIIVVTLIFERLMLMPTTAAGLTPYHWVDSGAVAITVLAGSTLAQAAPNWIFLQQLLPFVIGLTLLFWVTATWWIPLLLALGVWRHVIKRYPIRYEPRYWDIVFPLGMYTTSTLKLAQATGIALDPISKTLIYIVLAAWAITFIGLLRQIARDTLAGFQR